VEEAERLRCCKAFDIVVAKALGSRAEKRMLYIAKDPGSSSIYPPDLAEIARHTTSSQFQTERTIQIDLERLEDVVQRERLPVPDYLKIDCEGAEGEILDGAGGLMNDVTGVLFEARFVEFYRGGSIFSALTDRFFRMALSARELNRAALFLVPQ